MASISGSGASPGHSPTRPSLMDDFCDHLAGTYRCPRKDFHDPFVATSPDPRIKDCDGLVYWLNLFELIGTAPTTPASAPLEAMISRANGGSNQKIKITDSKIDSGDPAAGPISIQTAYEMALLAAANPNFKGQPLTLTGSREEIQMLTFACEQVGLTVDNPISCRGRKKANFAANWTTFYGRMRHHSEIKYHDRETKLRSDFINNTTPAVCKPDLGTIKDADYQQGKEFVWQNDRDIDAAGLHGLFSSAGTASPVSVGECGQMLKAMIKEDFVEARGPNFRPSFTKECFWRNDL